MTNKELLEDLLIEFDELDMQPMTIVPDPLDRAKAWKHELTYAIKHLKADVVTEFATKLKNYPINVRLPLLGLETKEEIESYVNSLFDQIESIVDKIAEEMKGGE